jgi:3-hydroxy-3-methylglutaryl CoA synthase
MSGIQSWGVCIPRLRVSRKTIGAAMGWVNPSLKTARGERSICNWDEDSLTMAVEAARCALPSRAARDSVSTVMLASTTLPFADRSNSTVLASALGLDDSALTLDVTGSQRSATAALAQALGSSGRGHTLVAAADRRLARPGSDQESTYGHGGAAIVVGADEGVAELVARHHRAADFVDHHRLTDSPFDYSLEERWVREAGWQTLVPDTLQALLTEAQIAAKDIAHLVIDAPPALARKIASLAGISESALIDNLSAQCGQTGAGHPLLMLASALERAKAGEWVVLVGFGHGVDTLLFRTTSKIGSHKPSRSVVEALGDRREETEYTRFLSHCGLLPVEFGMRAERDSRTAQTVAWRRHEDIYEFTGGRCTHCGTVQFPRARVCVAPTCREAGEQEPVPLAEKTARIKTFTEDWLAFSPRPPLVYGNVAFAVGGNAFIEFADFAPGEAQVNDEVRFVFRLKDIDRTRGFRRYFWKAAPMNSVAVGS